MSKDSSCKETPLCPRCGWKAIKNGSVRGRKRFRCLKCGKTFGFSSLYCFSPLRTPLAEIVNSLLILWHRGSFSAAEKVTGHKAETLCRWVRYLYRQRENLCPDKRDFQIAYNIRRDEFIEVLETLYKKIENKDHYKKGWANIELSSSSSEQLLETIKSIITNPELIDPNITGVDRVVNILYQSLWKDVLFGTKGDALIVFESFDRELTYEFVKTLPTTVVALELSANWSEAMKLVKAIHTMVSISEDRLKEWQRLLRQRLFDVQEQRALVDWCYMKRAQFYHKVNPNLSIKITHERKEYQQDSKLGANKPHLEINATAWLVLFLMQVGRVEEKQTEQKLERVLKEYSLESRFPRRLLATYYSLRATNACRHERLGLLMKLERVADELLSSIDGAKDSSREISSTYIDIAQWFKKLRRPSLAEEERLQKAAKISIRYGLRGQARQLLQLARAKRFSPEPLIYNSLLQIAEPVKYDKLYRQE
jgi:transposase-like protein